MLPHSSVQYQLPQSDPCILYWSFMKFVFTKYFPFLLLILGSVVISASSYREVQSYVPNWYADYDVKFYKLDIEVNDTTTNIAGNVTITCQINVNKLDTFKFELYSALALDSTLVNDKASPYLRTGDVVSVLLSKSQMKGQLLTIKIFYKGTITGNGFFSPVTTQRDNFWKISTTWTLSEPLGAKYWFPCKQYLPDKADSAWIFITVPKHCKAGSNGLLTGITPLDTNKLRYEWKTRFPIAYYLISFSVSDYQDYSFYVKLDEGDSVLVQNFVYNRPDYLETNKVSIDKTGDFLKYFSGIYGKYPFQKEKYGHCLAPMGGGMEHQTMTTLNGFGRSLVSHELAHQWFGDLVTCATWQDIWVNEGFASYSEYLDLDALQTHESAMNWMISAHQSALAEPNGSVYVPQEDDKNDFRIFNYNLTYKKGASIIHMLRYELNNDSLFFKILRQYLNDFKNTIATGRDFINVVSRLSGQDYAWFLNQWYFGKGFPIFDLTWNYQQGILTLISKQTSSSSGFFKTHFDLKLNFSTGDSIIKLNQDDPIVLFRLPIEKEVISLSFDPEEWLLKKVTTDKVPELPSFDNYLEVLPNPFSDELNLSFKTLPIKDQSIKLIDMKGDTVLEVYGKKKVQVKLNTTNIVPGTYLLYVFDGSTKCIRKVVKTK